MDSNKYEDQNSLEKQYTQQITASPTVDNIHFFCARNCAVNANGCLNLKLQKKMIDSDYNDYKWMIISDGHSYLPNLASVQLI